MHARIPGGCLAALILPILARAAGVPVVAVSVEPQAYFVDRVAGPLVGVEVLIPPGANEASFEPTMHQMQAISKAVLYVKVGHPHFLFEQAWLRRLADTNPDMRIVDGSAGAAPDEDPHVWVAPSTARVMAKNIEAALVQSLPEHRGELESNLHAFERDIDALDAELHAKLAPYAGRKFLVAHPAWGRFAREYGLQQVTIASEAKEPSPGQIAQLIEEARAAGIRTVFVQPQVSSKEADLIASQIGARVVRLDPLARDWLANLRTVGDALVASFQP
jgi:zinc transport system substrate-binding protein